jgi:hypothetical protein
VRGELRATRRNVCHRAIEVQTGRDLGRAVRIAKSGGVDATFMCSTPSHNMSVPRSCSQIHVHCRRAPGDAE